MTIDFNNPPCPYGYPLRMIDRVHSIDETAGTLIAYKALSRNEPLVQGHFPGFPLLPGILQIETLAQASSLLINAIEENVPAHRLVLAETRFKYLKPVTPGDLLRVETKLLTRTAPTYKFRGRILVGDEEAMKGEFVLEKLVTFRSRQAGATG